MLGARLSIKLSSTANRREHASALLGMERAPLRCSRVLLSFILLTAKTATVCGAENVIRLPVQVDQSGKTIYFVTDADSDIEEEAARFCAAHLRTVNQDECVGNLVAQVGSIRKARQEAAHELPGLTFTVNNHAGETITFVHEEGADPAAEAKVFCAEHFSQVAESDCVEAMLRNAARALEEIKAKYGGGAKDEV